jgi:hypothetical protein
MSDVSANEIASMADAKQTTLRSPFGMAVSWLLGFAGLLTILTSEPSSVLDVVIGVGLLGIPCAWVILRVPWLRVTLSETGLTNHGLVRNKTIAWTIVGRVYVDDAGILPLAISYAPVLDLDGQSNPYPLMDATLGLQPEAASQRVPGRPTDRRHYQTTAPDVVMTVEHLEISYARYSRRPEAFRPSLSPKVHRPSPKFGPSRLRNAD